MDLETHPFWDNLTYLAQVHCDLKNHLVLDYRLLPHFRCPLELCTILLPLLNA